LKHSQSQAEAIAHIKRTLEEHRTEILAKAEDVEERWEGNVLHFAVTTQGQHISGTLTVLDHAFDIDVTLPLMLRMFEGRIKKAIEEQASGLLK
jgi:hypothetical protein